MPYSAAIEASLPKSGGWLKGDGIVRVAAGSDRARTKFSKPPGSATSRMRAWADVTLKACGMVAGPVDERSGGRLDRFAADPESQLAFRDVEPLVLVVVDMQRRSWVGRRAFGVAR
jgi:hypothetical protein